MKFAYLFLFFFVACAGTNNKDIQFYDNWIKKNHLSHYKAIVIIPSVGCEGCITGMEKFVLENAAKSKNILYVFTEINSPKALKIRLRNLSENNIYFDVNNELQYWKKDYAIYPSVIILKNEKARKILLIKPSTNTGYEKLYEILVENDSN